MRVCVPLRTNVRGGRLNAPLEQKSQAQQTTSDAVSNAKISIPRNVYCVNTSGGDSKEDPPVPMPNTEVKLLNVDDTWRVTARESRKLPELSTQ